VWILETTSKAEQGDADAQYSLGMHYYCNSRNPNEEEIEKQKECAKWMHKAAEQGHGMAQNMVSLIYCHGFGVPQDDAEAAKWLRKSAENDSTREQHRANAQYLLGNWYYHGQGVTKDKAEAVKWYRKAAEQEVNAEARGDALYVLPSATSKGKALRRTRKKQ
jgi:TPR repeat protein